MDKNSKINTLVILAGGLGTRLAEETQKKPKPMVKIGTKPIIWHIIKHYQHYGFKNFIICAGYKGYMIKKFIHRSKDLSKENIKIVNTGLKSLTATRLSKVKFFLPDNFCLTYGDAVSNININKLIDFHKKMGRKNLNKRAKLVPLKRMADPSEISNAVIFLSSGQSKYITNSVIDVRGGE